MLLQEIQISQAAEVRRDLLRVQLQRSIDELIKADWMLIRSGWCHTRTWRHQIWSGFSRSEVQTRISLLPQGHGYSSCLRRSLVWMNLCSVDYKESDSAHLCPQSQSKNPITSNTHIVCACVNHANMLWTQKMKDLMQWRSDWTADVCLFTSHLWI